MKKLLEWLWGVGVWGRLVRGNLNGEGSSNSEGELKGVKDMVIEKGEEYNLVKGISG